MTKKSADKWRMHKTRNMPSLWDDAMGDSLLAVTTRAFAPSGTRVTVCKRTLAECREATRAICRDFKLPLRATMATLRQIKTPYLPGKRAPRA